MKETTPGLTDVPVAATVLAYMLPFAKGWPTASHNQQARRYERYVPIELRGRPSA